MMTRFWIAGALICLAAAALPAAHAQASGVFPDVPSDHPYVTAIESLASKGIIGGYASGKFGPGDPVVRQQFAKMIVLAMGFAVTEQDSHSFSDVSRSTSGLYPYAFVAVAANNGLATGYDDGSFRPLDKITRMQVLTMVARATGSLLLKPPDDWRGLLDSSDPSHGEDIRWAEYGGLVDGIKDLATWDPRKSATRGEVALILHDLLVKTSFHPPLDATLYGARGDGTTDNTQAIQKAIEACPAGSSVVIPAGTYSLGTSVRLKSGTSVRGAGTGKTILTMPGQSEITGILCGSNLSNVTVSGITFAGPGGNSNIYGFVMEGSQDCRLNDCRFEGLSCGMKLGAGNMAHGWEVSDIIARDCRLPLYVDSVSNSTFSRLDLRAAHLAAPTRGYALYVEGDCSHLTFVDCTLSGGSGWTMHLYYDYEGEDTSHDIAFNNTTIDATDGDYPIVIGRGFYDIRFTNTTLRARSDTEYGYVVRFLGGRKITFDGFTATGGRVLALVEYPEVMDPADFVFRNGSFDGADLGTGVIFENVTAGR
jgi:hypothetical protein